METVRLNRVPRAAMPTEKEVKNVDAHSKVGKSTRPNKVGRLLSENLQQTYQSKVGKHICTQKKFPIVKF